MPTSNCSTGLLLVEDSLSDIDLILDIFEDIPIAYHLDVVRDGEEAVLFLHRQGKYKNAPRPNIILLDLNLPKKDGYEVLIDIKSDPQLRHIPVIVFTTSDSQQDILRAYNLHANAYMLKSGDIQGLIEAIRAIEHYWISTAKLPQS